MKTTVIDGVEYQLVPVQKQDDTTDDQPKNSPSDDAGSILADFVGESGVVSHESAEEPSTASSEQIRIVDTTVGQVQQAQPKEYEYRKKFLNRELTPQDVVGRTGIPPQAVKQFKDVPEIEADRGGKHFYGPGLEFDYTY